MKIDPNEILSIAKKTADKSPCRFRVSCLIVNHKGEVIAKGWNHWGNANKMGRRTVHAELDACNQIRKPSTGAIAFLYRANSRPINCCSACNTLLKSYGIETVYVITETGWKRE